MRERDRDREREGGREGGSERVSVHWRYIEREWMCVKWKGQMRERELVPSRRSNRVDSFLSLSFIYFSVFTFSGRTWNRQFRPRRNLDLRLCRTRWVEAPQRPPRGCEICRNGWGLPRKMQKMILTKNRFDWKWFFPVKDMKRLCMECTLQRKLFFQ